MGTWKQGNGYGGFLLHCIHGIINFGWAKPVTSYTYKPLLEGFYNLYLRTGDVKWEKQAEEAETFLLNMMDKNNLFRYSTFELAPKEPGLVHNALSALALLKSFEITKNPIVLEKVKNCLKSMIAIWWNGNQYNGTVNQDLSLVAVLAKYARLTRSFRLFRKYGLPVAKWSLSLAGDKMARNEKIANAIVRGCFRHDKTYVYPWYNTKMAEMFFEVFLATRNEKWLARAVKSLKFAFDNFVEKKGLVHSYRKVGEKWICIEKPTLVVPMFYLLSIAEKIKNHKNFPNYRNIRDFLKNNQIEAGYYRNTMGFGVRDFIGSLPWNSFAFEYLSLVKSPPEEIDFADVKIGVEDYLIQETSEHLNLSRKGKTFFSVNKSTGKISCRIHEKISTGRIEVGNKEILRRLHLIRVRRHIVERFGCVDTTGRYFIPWKDGETKLWHPEKNIHSRIKGNQIEVYASFLCQKEFYRAIAPVFVYLTTPLIEVPLFHKISRTKDMFRRKLSRPYVF
jgi:hypothetical protein